MRIRLVVLVAAGALVSSGCSVWAFGNNDFGQLGDGTDPDRPTPTPVGTLDNWYGVNAGNNATEALLHG